MPDRNQFRNKSGLGRAGERGQTLILVAASLVSLLAMGAIAIDVVTLYVARSETQRAADAAALAGAQELVANSVPSDPCNAALATTAQAGATALATSIANQNMIAGGPPDTVTVTYPNGSAGCAFGVNPRIQVTVQRQNLPNFFARIWSRATNTVTAVATAEAYDPANSSVVAGTSLPIAPSCVRPMLLPNCNPDFPQPPGDSCAVAGGQDPFFDKDTGDIKNQGTWIFGGSGGGVIGEPLQLTARYDFGSGNSWGGAPKAGYYYPLNISAASATAPLYSCPGCASTGDIAFQKDLECCNSTTLQCGTVTPQPTVDTTTDYRAGTSLLAEAGGQCLIHEAPTAPYDPICWTDPNDQDCLDRTLTPYAIRAGINNPFLNALPTNLAVGSAISTSDSIITVPVYDQTAGLVTDGTPITVIGFLQLFIADVGNGTSGRPPGVITTRVLNVIGCGSAASGAPVFGTGPAIPVRLIANP